MTRSIGYIVEGHGDVVSVPIVVRRIAAALEPPLLPMIPEPVRAHPGNLVDPGDAEMERKVELAVAKANLELTKAGIDGGTVVVHIVIDRESDRPEDCPARLGPELLRRATLIRGDVPIAVTLAKQEFEAWFLAAAESIAGRRGLPANLQAPPDPEGIRDAKGWLGGRMGRKYYERQDQPALAAKFDLAMARRRSDSFDKFYRDTVRLLTGPSHS